MIQVTDVPGFGSPQIFILLLNILIIAFVGYLIVYWIHNRNAMSSPDDSKEGKVSVRTVTSLFAVTALVSPVLVNIYPHEVYGNMYNLMGMTWMMINMNFWDIVIDPLIILSGFSLTFMRLVFVYQIHRYLRSRTTKKRTIIVGILSELQTVIMILPVFVILSLLRTFELVSGFWFFPIPVLLLVGLVIIRVIPVTEVESPW
jgi:hypothetical protein